MRRRFALARLTPLALVAALVGAGGHASAQTPGPQEWAKGRLIIGARAGLSQGDLDKLLRPHGGRARRLGGSDLHVVELPPNVPETVVQRLLHKHPLLKFAELDFKVSPNFQPNDPYVPSQWHLGTMRMNGAWENAAGSGVTIAILDTGVLSSHADLAANALPGWNAYDNNSATGDVHGHGTLVAGTAAAVVNNATGVAGIAGAARFMPIRVTDTSGMGYYSTIASGITYAADRGARVANASFHYLFSSSAVISAANYMKSKGGLVVVCAGNNGANENAGATSSMIVVSATDANDNLAGWSSYGNMVSMSAPGVGIWTTAANGGYASANGTSFASPAVAGVAAVMMSVNPSLGPNQIESLLFSTAVDLGAAGRDIYFGYGRVDAEAAVSAARAATAVDSQRPSVAIASPAGGTTVSGLVPIDVSASDNVGVTRVELRVNGALVSSDVAAPYQFSWDSTGAANGGVSLTAVAYDAAGNAQTSAAVSVNVANAVASDITAPTVSIKSPQDGAQVSGTVQVRVAASDDAGSSGLTQRLFIDGAQVASSSGGSLNYAWNTRKASMGSHTLTVQAVDAAGNIGTSSIRVIRVK